MTTFISFAISVLSMLNNAYFIQYHFKIILLHITAILLDALPIGTRAKFFWSASRELMRSVCFRIGLDLDDLILVLIFGNFLSTFVKMANFQGIKDFSDIFLSDNNFPLIRLSKPSTTFSLLWFPVIRTFTCNLMKFFIFDYPLNLQL